MNEKTFRFDFAQLRFVIAAVLLIAAGLKAYQLATVPLPPVVQDSMFTLLLELLNDRYFQMTVVIGEILFALVLISGLWRSWTWLLSLLGFSMFTLISIMKGVSGEDSCGCFGTVTVNPWLTAAFDAIIVGLLLVFRERIDWALPKFEKKKVLIILITWLAFAVPTTFFMLSLKQQPHETLGIESIGADGRSVIELAPGMWIDKKFPLIPRFAESEGSEILLQGTWNILLVQPNCSECVQMLTELEERKPENLAIVVIPSRRSATVLETSFPMFVLDRQSDWVTHTPRVIRLSDGMCISVGRRVAE